MKEQGVSALRKLYDDRVIRSLRRVVLREFGAQSSGLYAHEGIEMGVKIRRPAEDFCGDLIFLMRNSRMPDCMVGEITKQLAERLGSLEEMTVYQLLDLEKTRFYVRYMSRNVHLTKRNKPVSLLASQQLTKAVTVTNPTETI